MWRQAGVAAVCVMLVAGCDSSGRRLIGHPDRVVGIPTSESSPVSTALSPSASTSVVAACTSAQLHLTRRSQANGGNGPGNYSALYLLVNDRSTRCTVSGYPQVTFAQDDGAQVDMAAPHLPSGTPSQQVTLGPGKAADFTLRAAVYEGPRCPGGIQSADQMRVVPSGQTSGVVLTGRFYFCALTGVTALAAAK